MDSVGDRSLTDTFRTPTGGLLVVWFQQDFSTMTLGYSQGLAGGFMLAVTLLEILPEALTTLTIATAVAWVCAGAVVIYLLKVLLID